MKLNWLFTLDVLEKYIPCEIDGTESLFKKDIAGFKFKLVISEYIAGDGLHISFVLHLTAKQKGPNIYATSAFEDRQHLSMQSSIALTRPSLVNNPECIPRRKVALYIIGSALHEWFWGSPEINCDLLLILACFWFVNRDGENTINISTKC